MEYYAVLPDEIVTEVLAPLLKVPECAFTATTYGSPFAKYELSTSTTLLVCKSWLRVATPLLYHTVVLRSKAQAQALEQALRSNSLLGTFIKRLRVEGGYGSSMYTILKNAPNLTDIWFTLVLFSADSVTGLVRGFPLINPTRVIVQDETYPGRCAAARQLRDALLAGIKSWEKMVIFDIGYIYAYHGPRNYGGTRNVIAEDLISFSKLEILYLDGTRTFPLYEIAQMPSLKEIRIKSEAPDPLEPVDRLPEVYRRVLQNPLLKAKVIFTIPYESHEYDATSSSALSEDQDILPLIPPDPNFAPLASTASETKDAIWREIIWHAMDLPDTVELEADADRCFHGSVQKYRCRLLLVSKTFYRVGLPFLYQTPLLYSTEQLAQTLLLKPMLGQYIRNLVTNITGARNISSTKAFHNILKCSSNLRSITTHCRITHSHTGHIHDEQIMDWKAFTTLAKIAGRSLILLQQSPHRASSSKHVTPEPLYHFTQLRSLNWNSQAKFQFTASQVQRNALPALEHLRVSSSNPHFLTLLSLMELPAIQSVEMPRPEKTQGAETLLKVHGHKLTHLRMGFLIGVQLFDLCPKVEQLILPNSTYCLPSGLDFDCEMDHSALTKVVIPLGSLRPTQVKESFEWLGSIDLSKFKALKEIQVYLCTWPIDERGIQKSFWVEWAERLLCQWNIKLTDETGKSWTPRLKPTKR